MKHLLTKVCPICHRTFETDGRGKKRYCSVECRKVVQKSREAQYYENKKAKKAKQIDWEWEFVPYVPDALDKKLADLKAQGKTYAQMQMGKTLEMARKAVW